MGATDSLGANVYELNERLRLARERIPSRRVPGESLSRQEVAELVNAWIYEHAGKLTELDANYIGKLERGVIRWPQRRYREALRAVLRVDTDVQLGFHTRRHAPTTKKLDRQQFVRLAGSVLALPWLDLFTPIEPTPVPARIGPLDIDQVRLATATFMGWDNAFGGGLARESVHAQLRWSAQLLHADCPDKLRPLLFSAVAELAGVAGFMAFDACAHGDARRTFRFSLSCAEESEDWHLRASILGQIARQSIWCGQPEDGLTQVEMALVRADRLTPTERASLHTLRARALAKLQRFEESLSAVGAADDAFSHTDPTRDPPWMAFYDHAQHHGDTGHALWDISIAGRPTQAARRLVYSIAHHGKEYARSRVMSQIKLAGLLMRTGDPREAAVIGQQALDRAGGIRSRRAIEDLQELRRFANRHTTIAEVAELRDRITETTGAA